ncbi:MAG: chorismate synthase [Bacteroides sp.]|nr:chorismate synthase [Bacteroides sp.]
MNTFGRTLRLASFGESHGAALGGMIDGFPAGVPIDMDLLQADLDNRKPAQSLAGSGRGEEDRIEVLSGVYQGKSLGSPIGFIIRNRDARSADYAEMERMFRPGHADDTYQRKYGVRDVRGGGRASARETAVRVAGGAFAKMLLATQNVQVHAYTQSIGDVALPDSVAVEAEKAYGFVSRCPHRETDEAMQRLLQETRQKKDSVGGVVSCIATGIPAGWGEPVYDKLSARLAYAMMGINAARGFEIGCGFEAARMNGSIHNDRWLPDGTTEKNLCGGVRGGISTGEPLVFRVAFKPVPSIAQEQELLGMDGKLHRMAIGGRHDVCCVPRAVSVVEAMAALCLADFMLLDRCSRVKDC